jgi:hypothetical protein
MKRVSTSTFGGRRALTALIRRTAPTTVALLLCAALMFIVATGQQTSGSSSVWTEETSVQRQPRPGRPHPRHKIEKARLLTLEYRVLERGQDGGAIEANPLTTFHSRDRIRLAIKANQDGYLYIINQTEDPSGKVVDLPHLIFPDSRIRNGQNFVKTNDELMLPAYCSPEYTDDQGRCWWWMNQTSGSEVVILVLSRDLITDLQDNIVGGVVKADYVAHLKASSGQTLKRTSRPDISPEQGGGAGRYITWVTNTNTKDNEELIEAVRLNHAAEVSRY